MTHRRRALHSTLAATLATGALTGLALGSAGPASAAGTGTTSTYIVQVAPALDVVPTVASGLVAPLAGTVVATYDHVLNGFAVRLPSAAAPALRALPNVLSVRPDVTVTATAEQSGATWGLDRIDQRALPMDGTYRYADDAGRSAHVYVIDTGINPDHAEFTGRVGTSRNFVPGGLLGTGAPDPNNWTDCEGHGTHVASTAAGTTWGVAKRATVHAVRVLDCGGSGSGSAILAGMDWVAGNHGANSVANLSLGTSARSADIDTAVTNLVASGVAVAVAAGNSNANACTTSPAAAPAVVTVGATTNTDARASYSNYGTCLDLFAPGSSITAADHDRPTGSTQLSGTSMASPHAAGVLALVRSAQPGLSATAAQDTLLTGATSGVVGNAGTGSPNKLLWSGVVGTGTPGPVEPPPPSEAPCTNCAKYSGNLAAGGTAYPLGSGGFTRSGTLRGYLRGPSTANFNLALQRRSCFLFCSWSTVASGTGATSTENVTYAAASGTYRWVVTAASGSGTYSFWF